jgi:hypothetical protein
MFSFSTAAARSIAAMTLALAAAQAQAQAAPAPARHPTADPTDANAPVPAMQYRSALGPYRKHTEQPVGDWSALNDQVRLIGGWRVYAREAAAPEVAPAAAGAPSPAGASSAPTTPGRPAAHGGHKAN